MGPEAGLDTEKGKLPCITLLIVMPMEKFVSCVGDLATLGGLVGRDLSPATPWFVFCFFFCYFVVRDALGSGKFYSGSTLTL